MNILWIEDDPNLPRRLKHEFSDKLNIKVVSNLNEFYESLLLDKYSAAFIDYNLSGSDDAFKDTIEEISKNSKVVLYTSLKKPGVAYMPLPLQKDLTIYETILSTINDALPEVEKKDAASGLITITSDIRLINNSLVDIISRNPNLVYEISPRQFEELIAELFEKEGYTVDLTPSTNDAGKDIYAFKKDTFQHYLYAVECKKYSRENKVGRPTIQKLNGVVESERLTGGILVTSSFFTQPAVEFTKKIKHRIFLNDYYDLAELLKKHRL